jgi:surface polysaccharide O-acyltransferase-like enzyme
LNTEYFILAGRILVSFWPYDYLPDYNPFISLWFTFALILCYLFFPVLKMICADNEAARTVKKYLMWMGLLFFIVRNSLLVFFPDNFTIQHLEWWIQEKPFYWLWLMMVGHELALYLRKREISDQLRRILLPSGIAAFIVGGGILFWLTMAFNVDESGDVNQRFFIREFVFYMLAQMGMFIFFAALKVRSQAISRLILFVADKTFYVYMIHEAVFKKLIKHTDFDITTVSGYLGFSVLAFALSLIFATLLKKGERGITRALKGGR